MKNEQVTGQIIKASLRVHSILGPVLLESAYRLCLAHELTQRGVQVQSELPVPIVYDGLMIDVGYRIELLVDARVDSVLAVTSVLRFFPAVGSRDGPSQDFFRVSLSGSGYVARRKAQRARCRRIGRATRV